MTLVKYSLDKKLEVVSLFMLLGNMRVVSEQMNIPYDTLCEWKRSDWWPELVEQVRKQRKNKTNKAVTALIEQSLEVMEDRLQNGDFIVNQKTGEIIRKPVGIKEATTIATTLLQRQIQLEELEQKLEHREESAQEVLSLIAKQFQKLKKNNATDIAFKELDNALHDQREERLQEGSGEVYQPAGSGEEASGAEQSSQDDGKGWQSSQRRR